MRRRNLIPADAIPYTRPLDALEVDVVLESGDYAGLLENALDRFGWAKLRNSIERRRAEVKPSAPGSVSS